jgi:phosphoglycerate dehydrogenase-like enzyme
MVYDPYVEECRFFRLAVRKTDLITLLRESHVISLHCSLTEETRCLVGEKEFSEMNNKPILINTARGPVVSEKALLSSLTKGHVRCAGVDVYHHEPLKGTSLKVASHARVLASQHYAWYSENAKKELQRRAAENMVTLLSGSLPDDCLNP